MHNSYNHRFNLVGCSVGAVTVVVYSTTSQVLVVFCPLVETNGETTDGIKLELNSFNVNLKSK